MMKNTFLPPGPKAKTPFGHLFAIRRDIIGLLLNLAREYGDIAFFKVGPMGVTLLNHPDHIRDVLITHHDNFVKGRPLEMTKLFLGDGLLTSEGELHMRHWKIIQPVLHRKRVDTYAAIMTRYATQLSDRWKEDTEVDILQDMIQMAMMIAGRALFDRDIESDEATDIGVALTSALRLIPRVSIPFSEWLLRLPLPSTFRLRKAKRQLDTFVYRLINERRSSGEDHGDLLSQLLDAQNHEGEKDIMTDEGVRDEALTLFLTAFDTTSLSLTWTWYLISQHPSFEAELHAELDAVLGGSLPTAEDLPRLKYTKMVFSEAMRLYPPLYVIARKALNDYPVGDYIVPAGSLVLMSPYVMHHDPRYYPDPYKFDPHRWNSDTRANLPKFAYFPFGGGPRGCIGEPFAWMEGILVLATLAQRWQMRLFPGHRVVLQPHINLRPRYGMRMVLHRRK